MVGKGWLCDFRKSWYVNILSVDNRMPSKRYNVLDPAPGWGDRLIRVREYRGFSQAQFVRATELSAPTVWRHEQGKAPRQAMLDRYAKILECDPNYLLFGEPRGNPPWADGDDVPPQPPGPPDAELWQQYFSTDFGRNTPADLRARLREFAFSSMGIAVPTLENCHDIRCMSERARATRV